MKTTLLSFQKRLLSFAPQYALTSVFQDFLKCCLCAFAYNPHTRLSWYEDEYLAIIGKYAKEYQLLFPDLLAALIIEMEASVSESISKDVLGEVYQDLFYQPRSAQYFTPSHITDMMAQLTSDPSEQQQSVLDPCCGSGRMLLSSAKVMGKHHLFYGIDIDLVCVHMTAINLFLNGIFHAEVLCADAIRPGDFRVSYRTSLHPFGIFRITEKEQSPLWQMHQMDFKKNETQTGKQLSIF